MKTILFFFLLLDPERPAQVISPSGEVVMEVYDTGELPVHCYVIDNS